jgi:putative transcriptional regulator
MSQPKFAGASQLQVATLRDREQGRRQPDRPAPVLLKLIDQDSETIRRMLAG